MRRLSLMIASLIALPSLASEVLIDDITVYDGQHESYVADVLIKNGVITKIGQGLSTSSQIINGHGKSLTAGLFNGDTHIGVEEVGAIKQTVDYRSDNTQYTAAFKVAEAINPDSVLIPYNRSLGLTHALVLPDNDEHIFAGSAAYIQMSNDGTVLNDSVGIVVNLGLHGKGVGGGSRATALAMLRTALDEAAEFAANKTQIMRGDYRELSLSHHDLEALQPILKRQKPLLVRVDRASEIRRVLALAEHYQIRLVLLSAQEAWRVADQIANAKVAVIMDPINNLPMGYDSLGARLDAAAILERAGVELIFTGMGGDSTHNAANVRQSAANAVSHGLSLNAAISAMTVTPAKVFNLSTGLIAEGQTANLVVWDGHPLEVMSLPEHVFVGGNEVSLVSRASRLADRYLQRIRAFQEK